MRNLLIGLIGLLYLAACTTSAVYEVPDATTCEVSCQHSRNVAGCSSGTASIEESYTTTENGTVKEVLCTCKLDC